MIQQIVSLGFVGQIYHTRHTVFLIFQKKPKKTRLISVDGQVNETQVTVYNSGRQFEPDGDIRDITGIAYVADVSEPGQLIVDLERQDPVDPPPGDCKCSQLKKNF